MSEPFPEDMHIIKLHQASIVQEQKNFYENIHEQMPRGRLTFKQT
jgi:hypothetical protein